MQTTPCPACGKNMEDMQCRNPNCELANATSEGWSPSQEDLSGHNARYWHSYFYESNDARFMDLTMDAIMLKSAFQDSEGNFDEDRKYTREDFIRRLVS